MGSRCTLPARAVFAFVALFLPLLAPLGLSAQQPDTDTPSSEEADGLRPRSIQDFEAPASRHALNSGDIAPAYHAALLPFLKRPSLYAAVSDEGLLLDHHVVRLRDAIGAARAGLAIPVRERLGLGFEAVTHWDLNDVGLGAADIWTSVLSGGLGLRILAGFSIGANLGITASTLEVGEQEQFFDRWIIDPYWSLGLGWASEERDVRIGLRVVNFRFDGELGFRRPSLVGYPEETEESGVAVEKNPAPTSSEGYFEAGFLDGRLRLSFLGKKEYNLGSNYDTVRDFSLVRRDFCGEYALTERIALRGGYHRSDYFFSDHFSTSEEDSSRDSTAHGGLLGASFMAFGIIWDVNIGYRQRIMVIAPWGGETPGALVLGLSFVRNW